MHSFSPASLAGGKHPFSLLLTPPAAPAACAPLPCPAPAPAATALVALLLGLNVVRTYQDKLRQFLADVAGEQPGAAAAVGAPAEKFE